MALVEFGKNTKKMEGKLIKVENGYVLMVNNTMYATDYDKLSLKNCQAIELGYDFDDKISKHLEKNDIEASAKRVQVIKELIFEILGEKKFSEIDVRKAIDIAWRNEDSNKIDIIQSIQQTEWEVEIEMEDIYDGLDEMAQPQYSKQPKLDADGCLILKRK